jgi:hypothetical protein
MAISPMNRVHTSTVYVTGAIKALRIALEREGYECERKKNSPEPTRW